MFTKIVNKINLKVGLELVLEALYLSNSYFIFYMSLQSFFLKKRMKNEEKKKNTIGWFVLELKNHKQHHLDHINQLKEPNLNFLLMLNHYKNLSILFVHFFLILLFLFILFVSQRLLIFEIKNIKYKINKKTNHFHIENQKKMAGIHKNNFHWILLNIVLHLNIEKKDNSSLFFSIKFNVFIF